MARNGPVRIRQMTKKELKAMRCKKCKLFSSTVSAETFRLCDTCSRLVLRNAGIGYGRTVMLEVKTRTKQGRPMHSRSYVPAQVEDSLDRYLDAKTGKQPVLNTFHEGEVWRRGWSLSLDEYLEHLDEEAGFYRPVDKGGE